MRLGPFAAIITALTCAVEANPRSLFFNHNSDVSIANVTSVPILLPIPRSTVIAKGTLTVSLFSNGTIIIGSLLSVPEIPAALNGLNFRLKTANNYISEDPSIPDKVSSGSLVGKALQNVATDISNVITIDIKGHVA